MKFGTQLGSLGKSDRKEALEYAKALGCQGLEVGLPVAGLRTGAVTLASLLAEAETMRRDFGAAGVEFISLTPDILLKNAQTPAVIEATCQVARVLGVRAIRMFMAPHVRWGGPKSVLNEWMAEFDGTHDAGYWFQRNTEELARIVDLSEGYDVRYVFELHHGYVVNSASGAMRILEKFPAAKVGILMDPGNMCFEGNEGWRNSVQIMGEYLDYIHCKNGAWYFKDGKWVTSWANLDDGIASFGEIVTALKDTGFQGYLSIEDLRGHLSPEERIGRGIAYLKGLKESDARTMPA